MSNALSEDLKVTVREDVGQGVSDTFFPWLKVLESESTRE